MNLNNHNHDIIKYGGPVSSSFRSRQRRLAGLNFSDRSPEVTAMNAHLRASAYPEGKRSSGAMDYLEPHGGAAAIQRGSFLDLMRQYENQARDEFSKETVLFAIITAIGLVWPIAYTLSAIAR